MVAMKTYRVVAKRWAHGWELHIDGVGVTQSRTLGEAEVMVRDYIAADLDASPDDVDVELAISLGDNLDALRQEVREASDRAAVAQTQAAERSRILVRRLRDAGLSGREIATVLDVSPQRVSQLLAARPGEGRLPYQPP
jgi:DNA-directed RNA polymerase specialized sigma subunit